MTRQTNRIPTGISKLDELLSGGLPNGSTFLVDTNSKANCTYLLGSIFAQRLLNANKVLCLNSSLTTLTDFEKVMELFGVPFKKIVNQKNIYFIEHYHRPSPPDYEQVVIDVSEISNEQYKPFLRETLTKVMAESIGRGEQWFIYYDLNTIFSQRGADFVTRFFAEEVAKASAYGLTLLVLCNFSEINPEIQSYLERASNGVIRTWVDGNYQYLQLTKSPHGKVSEPLIIESVEHFPYISLF